MFKFMFFVKHIYLPFPLNKLLVCYEQVTLLIEAM